MHVLSMYFHLSMTLLVYGELLGQNSVPMLYHENTSIYLLRQKDGIDLEVKYVQKRYHGTETSTSGIVLIGMLYSFPKLTF